MKLIFMGDRITGGNSAYSKIGFETCTRLAKMGHNIAHIPMGRANQMGKYGFGKILIYTSGNDPFAEDAALQHYHDFNADIICTIKEPWVFNHIFRYSMNFVPMAIIDHAPVSPAILARLGTAFKVIAVSRFGQLELKRAGVESEYIPHGVRTSIYKPLPNRDELRKLFGLDPEAFVVLLLARNQVRKMIPRQLRGFKLFLEQNPDVKIQMMLWTNIQPPSPPDSILGVSDVGVNLLPEIMRLGLNENVIWPQWQSVEKIGGLPEYNPNGGWDMVKLYNCADAYCLCSGGEAAGLPYLESAACGVPSIGSDYAGAPEYIGSGLPVPYSDWVINNTPGVRYVMVNLDRMVEALTKILNGDKEKMAQKARKHAERYDWKIIMERYWKPFLGKCETELYPKITSSGTTAWSVN